MPLIRVAADAPHFFMARLDSNQDSNSAVVDLRAAAEEAESLPATVRVGKEESAVARDGEAAGAFERPGRKVDVKPDLHWILEPDGQGGYLLLPVDGWWEFAKKAQAPVKDTKQARREREEMCANEIQKESDLRSQFSKRWSGISQRRMERVGTEVASGKQAMAENPPEKRKADDTLFPEKEALEDETGIKREEKKRKKNVKKKVGAHAEDEDAPETANSMLNLKSEKGEDGWDFDDEGNFSDDEQEKFDFDDQLDTKQDDEVPPSPGEDAEEAEDPTALDNHGQEIEVLLKEGLDAAGVVEEDADEEVDGEEPEEEYDERSPSPAAAATVVQPPLPVAQPARQMGAARSSNGASPSAAKKQLPNRSAPGDNSEVRRRAIECLRDHNGVCSAQAACAALGVDTKDKANPLYAAVLKALKDVAEVKSVAGHDKRVLVLKPEYMAAR